MIPHAEVYEKEPDHFLAQIQVAACYLEVDKKFLFLERAAGKIEPHRWGVPAGKLEAFETPERAAVRELFEETGIKLESSSQILYVKSLYVRRPEMDFVYHMFKVFLDRIPSIHLSDEHEKYVWASLEELHQMPLISGAWEALQYYISTISKM